MNTSTFPETDGKLESTAFMSLDKRFRIRPSGTRSKNSLSEEKSRLLIISLCMCLDIRTFEKVKASALKKAKTPYATPIATYQLM